MSEPSLRLLGHRAGAKGNRSIASPGKWCSDGKKAYLETSGSPIYSAGEGKGMDATGQLGRSLMTDKGLICYINELMFYPI